MNLTNLDAETRKQMRAEVEQDIANGTLYIGSRLSPKGREEYPALLLAAVDSGNTETLAAELANGGRLLESETATRKGKTYVKAVPVNAHETMAEGEFNRFYARGLCRRAVAEEKPHVRVYRAKAVANARSASEAAIGTMIPAQALLDDLRSSIGIEPALKLPPGANSGLSVQLP